MGRSGLNMMKAMARVVPTGACKCRFRHSGATLKTHATKSVSPSVSPWLGTFGDEGPSGSPSWVERLLLDHGAKTLPELTAPVWDRASATSRPCHMAVAFVSATLRLAGVRLLWPALSPMGSRISSLLRRCPSFESLIPRRLVTTYINDKTWNSSHSNC